MPGMSFHKGYSHITSKALTGRSHPEDLPEHAILETGLQNCARKRKELLTSVD